MNIALDLGSTAFRTLRRDGSKLVARQLPTLYLSIPQNTPASRLIARAGITPLQTDGFDIITGQDALEIAEFLQTPLSTFLAEGRVPENDPIARQLIATSLDALIPTLDDEPGLCVLALPGRHVDLSVNPELNYFTQVIGLKNYQLLPLHASLALGLAELGDTSFTGLALTMGASCCELSVIRYGVEVAYASISRGGFWLEEELAQTASQFSYTRDGKKYLDVLEMHRWIQSDDASLKRPKSDMNKILAERFQSLMTYLIEEMTQQLSAQKHALAGLHESIPLVIGGGLSQLDGAHQVFEKRLGNSLGSVGISQLRLVSQNTWTICRGCLIHAELEANYHNSLSAA